MTFKGWLVAGIVAPFLVMVALMVILSGGSRSTTAAGSDGAASSLSPALLAESGAQPGLPVTPEELTAALDAAANCMEAAGVTPIRVGDPLLDGELQLAWRVLPGQDRESVMNIASACGDKHSAHLQAAFASEGRISRTPGEQEAAIKSCLREKGIQINAINGETIGELMESAQSHQTFVECTRR